MKKIFAFFAVLMFMATACFAEVLPCKKQIEDFSWGLRVASPDRVKRKFTSDGKLSITTGKFVQEVVNEVSAHGHFVPVENMAIPKIDSDTASEEWANGVSDYGDYWTISYIVTNNCRFFLVYTSKEPSKSKSEIVGGWELVHE